MVARKNKERSESPGLNVRIELDNKALKAKNSSLTQTVAKLQQDNAELAKQISVLQKESYDIGTKYNKLKQVISAIDSTTKMILPKFNDVVGMFTPIIQLCSISANLNNFSTIAATPNKSTRTQAVKPHIVNGHILHNPTITLSRMSNDNTSRTPPRSSRPFNDVDRPTTSNSSSESGDREGDSDSDNENSQSDNEAPNSSFIRRDSRRLLRNQADSSMDTSRLQENFIESDDRSEESQEEDGSSNEQCEQRLATIHEAEEEEEELLNNVSPSRSRQHRFQQGRFQEVQIFLDQLPITYIEQISGSGNISISVSPPERRSSFQHRSSSLVGNADASVMDNERLYLEEQLNRSRMSPGDVSFGEGSRPNQSNAKLNVSLKNPVFVKSAEFFGEGSNGSNNMSEQFTESISAIHSLQTPSTSSLVHNQTNSMKSETLPEMDLLHIQLQHKTSTPIVSRLSDGNVTNRSGTYNSPNRSKNDSLAFKTNITKRKTMSREKRKVARVLLSRLSMEKRLSGSPIKGLEDIVNVPLITKSSNLKKGADSKSPNANSDEENIEKPKKGKGRRKKDSPTKKAGNSFVKLKKMSPPKNPTGRPKRAARPTTLKEPNLTKKLRRSK